MGSPWLGKAPPDWIRPRPGLGSPLLGRGQAHPGDGAAPGARPELDLHVVGDGQLPGDGKPKTTAPGAAVAGALQAMEGPEDGLPLVLWDAWAPVQNKDHRGLLAAVQAQFHRLGAVAQGIVQEVADDAPEGQGALWR